MLEKNNFYFPPKAFAVCLLLLTLRRRAAAACYRVYSMGNDNTALLAAAAAAVAKNRRPADNKAPWRKSINFTFLSSGYCLTALFFDNVFLYGSLFALCLCVLLVSPIYTSPYLGTSRFGSGFLGMDFTDTVFVALYIVLKMRVNRYIQYNCCSSTAFSRTSQRLLGQPNPEPVYIDRRNINSQSKGTNFKNSRLNNVTSSMNRRSVIPYPSHKQEPKRRLVAYPVPENRLLSASDSRMHFSLHRRPLSTHFARLNNASQQQQQQRVEYIL